MATVIVPKGTTDLSGLTITDEDNLHFVEGGQVVSEGLTESGLATGLTFLRVFPTFAGSVGGAAHGAFKADIITALEYNAGGGSFYYEPSGAADSCAKLMVAGSGRFYATGGGTIVEAQVDNAYLSIAAAVLATNIRQGGGTIEQLYNATANTDWTIDGGVFRTGRGFSGTARISGGAEIVVAREDSSSTLPTGGTGILGDGRVKWRGGNAGTWYVGRNAMLDLSEAPADMTITVVGHAKAIARSILKSRHATVTATVTEYGFPRDFHYMQGAGPSL